jgi:hypothetical protein
MDIGARCHPDDMREINQSGEIDCDHDINSYTSYVSRLVQPGCAPFLLVALIRCVIPILNRGFTNDRRSRCPDQTVKEGAKQFHLKVVLFDGCLNPFPNP